MALFGRTYTLNSLASGLQVDGAVVNGANLAVAYPLQEIVLQRSTTWQPIANGKVIVTVIGAGGGTDPGASSTPHSGAGAGGLAQSEITVSTTDTYVITVGAAGNSADGGTSSFVGEGYNLVATGGKRGYRGYSQNGGAGGSGSGGQINRSGGAGCPSTGGSYYNGGGGAVGLFGPGNTATIEAAGGQPGAGATVFGANVYPYVHTNYRFTDKAGTIFAEYTLGMFDGGYGQYNSTGTRNPQIGGGAQGSLGAGGLGIVIIQYKEIF